MSLSYEMTDEVLKQLSGKGAFLTAGKDKPNTMTVGWGSVSVYWGLPVFIVPVRHSRYTFGLLEEGSEFTVSVPLDGSMDKALGICGSKSGRDVDKYELAELSLKDAKSVDIPVIDNCGYYYECKILTSCDLEIADLPKEIAERFYQNGDKHRLYFGQIVAAYKA